MKKILKFGGFAFLALLGLIFISALFGGENTTQQTQNNTTEKTTSRNEPKQEKAPEKTPEPITLTGSGQQATSKFTLKKGLSIFKIKHTGGNRNFTAYLVDGSGEELNLLANEIGSANVSKATNIRSDGDYLLNVNADGNWEITIEQPRSNNASSTRTFTGSGQQATELFNLDKGLKTFKITHTGKSGNFTVYLVDNEGNDLDLLANEIGAANTSKAVGIRESGIYLLNVNADGDWSITIQ